MKKSINRPGIAYWVINKTLKVSFQMWLYVVCPHWVKAIYLCFLPHPCYLSIHSFSASDKRGLIVNKAKGLTELWTPAADQTILFAQVR